MRQSDHNVGIKTPRSYYIYIMVLVCMDGRWFDGIKEASKGAPCISPLLASLSNAVWEAAASPHQSSSRFCYD